MREAAFVKKNRDRWLTFEEMLKSSGRLQPDLMADCYLQIINDLSFAQTYYGNSQTTLYLNRLAQQSHFSIYKNRKEKSNRIVRFWKTELPTVFARYQKDLLASFIIFFVSGIIGFFSVYQDADFIRIIMGDEYVDMTLANIRDGDPMGVYHQENAVVMFIKIASNNIAVGFRCFVIGILTPVFTVIMLFYNGVMLGSFDGFLVQQGVGVRGNSILWIHGIFEIFVIIVCGAAGLILGKSVLLPDTYTRLQSVRRGFRDGTKICFSTVPFFLVAAFLESFVTRHSRMPLVVAWIFIFVTLSIIVFYYIIYPRKFSSPAFRSPDK
ncbi:MAG: stage II sporulation protein M [Prevotellaceae bacterium]|jgi:uncharacterized membrane protein SpoIIM required for sporulation|nr:stage II sporulation protein M [Prevotellaceae bacterium]